MRSELLGRHPALRRALPWLLWGLAALVTLPLAVSQAGIGSSPAVIAARTVALAPMRTEHRARIAKVLVEPGQRVQAGDLLVQLDLAEIDAELAVARAKLAYVEMVAGWRERQAQDDRARTAHVLATTAERSDLDVTRIIMEAERDRSELAQLEANLALEDQLVGGQLASAERLRALKQQRAALARKVEEYGAVVARARRTASRSTGRLAEWRQAADGVQAARASSSLGDDARRAAGEIQRREIARLELLRQQHALRAPFAARVGEVRAHVGELAADSSLPLLTLVEEQSTVAIAYVAQDKADHVRLGDVAKLVPRGLRQPPLRGRVTALAPSISEIPERFRRVPGLREYGRSVYIRLDVPAHLPGQALDAVFAHGNGGGA